MGRSLLRSKPNLGISSVGGLVSGPLAAVTGQGEERHCEQSQRRFALGAFHKCCSFGPRDSLARAARALGLNLHFGGGTS